LKFLLTLSIIFFLTPHSLSAEKNGLYVSSLDGTQIKFSDLLKKNQWNIIFVWTTYCTHCDDQYQFLTNIHSSDKDITVIGLNLDGLNFSKKVQDYKNERKHSFKSYLVEVEVFKKLYNKAIGYQFSGTPTYLLYKDKEFKAFLDGPTSATVIRAFIKSKT